MSIGDSNVLGLVSSAQLAPGKTNHGVFHLVEPFSSRFTPTSRGHVITIPLNVNKTRHLSVGLLPDFVSEYDKEGDSKSRLAKLGLNQDRLLSSVQLW